MKNVKYKIIISAIVLLYAVILYFSPVSCFFLKITGMKCPGCGMTRALISAAKLNFRSAWEYHKMFWSVPLLYIAFLKDGKMFSSRIINILFYGAIALGFFANWQLM